MKKYGSNKLSYRDSHGVTGPKTLSQKGWMSKDLESNHFSVLVEGTSDKLTFPKFSLTLEKYLAKQNAKQGRIFLLVPYMMWNDMYANKYLAARNHSS